MSTNDDFEASDDSPAPSKSQRKREAQAIKGLGQRLVDLSGEQLERLPLDDRLRGAVIEAQRMRRGGALKRQIQYVAKLLRGADTVAIEAALSHMEGHSRESAQQFHRLERWREGLIAGDPKILDELFDRHGQVDRQQLNHLVRQAQREQSRGGDDTHVRKHYRELFRFLRDLEEAADTGER